MAICCNLLVGHGERRKGGPIVFILPVGVSISFLIADLDRLAEALSACIRKTYWLHHSLCRRRSSQDASPASRSKSSEVN